MKLNYKVSGDGFPVIILHGLYGSLDNWQTMAKYLSGEFKVYIVDLRNHGRSPHSEEHSYPSMVNDLKQFYEDHRIERANIIGHSMGGKVAMSFALKYPALVNKLVVVDIAPKAYQAGHDQIFEALFELDLSKVSKRQEADRRLKHAIPDLAVRQFLLKNLSRAEDGSYTWRINLKSLFKNYNNINAAIESDEPVDVDTLVIRGEQSGYIIESDFSSFNKLFANVQITTISSAGHWVHAEATEEFLKEVSAFLS